MKIRVNNLIKKYGKKEALSKVNITLENGIYALIGPNGAGKTTFIHCLVGLLNFESGEIVCEEPSILFQTDEYISYIGYLPQYPSFYKNYTAEEFLQYMCVLKGIGKKKRKQKIDELLNLVNLFEKKDDKIYSFSGGMKQRLGIAQALLNDPKLLILDEPTSGLDPKERIRFKNILLQLSKDRIVIFSTHIISDIEDIADRIILLKNGKIISESTIDSLIDNLNGKVREISMTEAQFRNSKDDLNIIKLSNSTEGYNIRFFSEVGTKVIPDLEDVYLYYFGE